MSITSRLAGYFSLGKDVNKVQGTNQEETVEGVVNGLIPELELSMSDEELTNLTETWKRKWEQSPIKAKVEKQQKENENYWIGKQFEDVQGNISGRPLVDNLIFEALEQALPVATKQNPEPVVSTDNTEDGADLASIVQKYLVYLADILCLKLKMKKVARYWAIYLLGVAKVGWSLVNDEVVLSVIRPQKLYLDPDATIDETGEYTGEFVGEVRKEKASDLIKRFPKKKTFLEQKVSKEGGTELQYVEWWTDNYVCWEMDKEILGKAKNPHFNHDGKSQQITDETGQVQTITIPPQNHFPVSKKPYIFLSIFNLGKQPYDDTSLITQNLPLQDLVNKRFRQIDKNADKMNGGGVFSSDNFTSEQATEASKALRDGGAVLVPGDVNRAYKPIQQPPLPSDIFNQLEDSRRELKDIFGVTGLGAGAISKEQTVRGKILTAQADTSRIGGGISEYLEQFADHVFNWFVQMMYVYYDQPHKAAIVGQAKADEEVQLQSSQLNRKLVVSVKDGSLIPKDSLTQANQAVDLASAGLLDPITLFKRLDFPNPQETAKNLYLWKTNPIALFPDLQKEMQQQPQQPQGGNQPDQPPQGNTADQMAQEVTPSLNSVPISGQNSAMPNI
jgi:hypothetical protein